MSKAALVIMAAGIGSRFGGGIKQRDGVIAVFLSCVAVFAAVDVILIELCNPQALLGDFVTGVSGRGGQLRQGTERAKCNGG